MRGYFEALRVDRIGFGIIIYPPKKISNPGVTLIRLPPQELVGTFPQGKARHCVFSLLATRSKRISPR